jgi:hypothetical protein
VGAVVGGAEVVVGAEVVGMVVLGGSVVVDTVVVVTSIVVDACSAGAVEGATADVSPGAVVINDCSPDPPHAATNASVSAAVVFHVLTGEQSASAAPNLMLRMSSRSAVAPTAKSRGSCWAGN